jgi:isoleucyl-tRNA synthetase
VANQYKKTMNLPKTKFSMRAGLAQHEPERLEDWDENDVYGQLLKKNEGHEKFVLHDGPPYANGPIHLGHAQNKISKDIINRYWSMRGYQTPYVPGWDCHGQPIEHKVEQMLGTEKFNQLPTVKIRELCRKMAVEQVDTQRQGFKRLGVLGEWANPYLTYTHDYDATDVEIFKAIFDKGAIYRGRKPVHWCTHCHTALAEAEIEYGDEVSPAIFVRFEMTTVPEGLEAYEGRLWVDIWTTTPWTLPADDAVILHPEADYVAVVVDGRAEIMAEALVEKDCEKFGYESYELARRADGEVWRMSGTDLCHNKYKQPIFGDQGVEGRVHLRRLRHARRRHRHRPHRTRPRRGRLQRGHALQHPRRDAGRRRRQLLQGRRHGHGRPVVRDERERREPEDHRVAPGARHAHPARGHQPQLPALLALQAARDLPRDEPMVRLHGQDRSS